MHHAAVGQGLHQLAGEGGLAPVGDPAARGARPSGSAAGHVRARAPCRLPLPPPGPPRSRHCGSGTGGEGGGEGDACPGRASDGPRPPPPPRRPAGAPSPEPPPPGPARGSHPPMPMMMFMARPAAARPDSCGLFLRGRGGMGTRRRRYRPPTCLSRDPGKGGEERGWRKRRR